MATRGKSPLNPSNRHRADQGPIQLRMTKDHTRITVKGVKGESALMLPLNERRYFIIGKDKTCNPWIGKIRG